MLQGLTCWGGGQKKVGRGEIVCPCSRNLHLATQVMLELGLYTDTQYEFASTDVFGPCFRSEPMTPGPRGLSSHPQQPEAWCFATELDMGFKRHVWGP